MTQDNGSDRIIGIMLAETKEFIEKVDKLQ